MAKGQFLNPHQKGIVKRYYEHKDDLMAQKLGETVSELFLAEAEGDAKKIERLWKGARIALANFGVKPARVEAIAGKRDLKALAELLEQKF